MKIISNASNFSIDNRMSSSSPKCVVWKQNRDFEKKSQEEHFHDAHSSPLARVRQDILVALPSATTQLPRKSCLKSSISSSRAQSLRRHALTGEEIEILLPGAKRPITRRLSVHFNEGVMVRKMRPTKSLTDKPEQLWLQDSELERIKRQVMQLVEDKKRYVELQDVDDDDSTIGEEQEFAGECTRGLERMMEPEKAKVLKFQAWDTICNEQFLQRKEGEFDADGLAEVYGCVTRRSAREALRRAAKDEEDIQGYLWSTRRTCRKFF
jgi:hypothetical protein